MMKFCPNCGKKVSNDMNFCGDCGASFDNYSNNKNDNVLYQENKTNEMAVVGFILSLFSLLTCGVLSIPSLIISIVGLNNAKKNNGNGIGFAIAGIVISSIFILFLLLFILALFLGFSWSYNTVMF